MLRWLLAALLLSACAPMRQAVLAPETETLATARAPGTDFRVVSWNVSRDDIYQQIDGFRAVLAALDADVLILDEMPVADDDSKLVSALAGLGDVERPWHVVYGISGYGQRSTIAAQLPMQRVAEFDHLQYSDTFARSWLDSATDQDNRERRQRYLSAGMAQVGARIRTEQGQLMVVGLDFQCCGNGGNSWEEAMRRTEAAALRAALESASAAQPAAGIVVGGDFNAVNGPAPLLITMGEPDLQTHLTTVQASHLDGVEHWTWDGSGTPFASGRLDYQMHDARLRVAAAWVFDSTDLPVEQQRELMLEEIEMTKLSQHRPVVVDYAWVNSP